MKKRVLVIILAVSIVLNLFFGYKVVLFYINDIVIVDHNKNYFLNETGFAIQNLERYLESGTEEEYYHAIGHLYSADTHLINIESEIWQEVFMSRALLNELWQCGLRSPQAVKENINEIIEVLSLIRADSDFDDLEAWEKLADTVKKIK